MFKNNQKINSNIGINATTIAKFTKIPRTTVLRKITKLQKSGIIKKIVALNSQPVEFGDHLIIFE